MFDTHFPGPILSDRDGFTDLVRRLDRAEPCRAGRGVTPELGFDEELRFDDRRPRAKHAGTDPASPRLARAPRKAPSMPKTTPNLRLVPPGAIDENLAVDDAQMHARNKSLSWKQYVRNLDTFLGLQLDFENTVGDDR